MIRMNFLLIGSHAAYTTFNRGPALSCRSELHAEGGAVNLPR